jgi:hypothetical protein
MSVKELFHQVGRLVEVTKGGRMRLGVLKLSGEGGLSLNLTADHTSGEESVELPMSEAMASLIEHSDAGVLYSRIELD